MTEGAPRVGQGGGAPHHPVAGGGDEDRRARRPHRPDRDAHVLHPEVLAAERDPVLGPQPPDELDPLDEPPQAILSADPETLVLDRPVAEAHTEREAASAHLVEGGDRLRDLHRVEERKLENVRSDLHVAGLGRDPGEHRHRLEVLELRDEEVLAGEQQLESRLAGGADKLEQVPQPRRHVVVPAVLERQVESHSHGSALPVSFAAKVRAGIFLGARASCPQAGRRPAIVQAGKMPALPRKALSLRRTTFMPSGWAGTGP